MLPGVKKAQYAREGPLKKSKNYLWPEFQNCPMSKKILSGGFAKEKKMERISKRSLTAKVKIAAFLTHSQVLLVSTEVECRHMGPFIGKISTSTNTYSAC